MKTTHDTPENIRLLSLQIKLNTLAEIFKPHLLLLALTIENLDIILTFSE
jgi:hypothetical protein